MNISILIPTFNHKIDQLISDLDVMTKTTNSSFEIIVLDDHSSDLSIVKANKKSCTAHNCSYLELEENKGRTFARDFLAKKASFKWLLFLDADVRIPGKTFLLNFIQAAKNHELIFGGIVYRPEKPSKNKILRWKYGIKRENRSVHERQKKPYLSIISGALFIQKEPFLKANAILDNRYGLDVLFAKKLEENSVKVLHIDNPVVHTGLEDSRGYLQKTKAGLKSLAELQKKELVPNNYRPLQVFSLQLKNLGMTGIYHFLFSKTEKHMEDNLCSAEPSLLLFDLYRLGYFLHYQKEL